MKATPEQLQRGVEKLIEELSDYDFADDLLISAARHAVGTVQWIDDIDEREEYKRDIYRALKTLGGVKLSEDKLMREDLEELAKATSHLKTAYLEILQSSESTAKGIALVEISRAIICIEKASSK